MKIILNRERSLNLNKSFDKNEKEVQSVKKWGSGGDRIGMEKQNDF